MKSVSFKIEYVRNQTEKQQIKNALDKIEGVQEVSIDRNRGMIEIEYNPPSTEELIMKCIEKTGHEIEKI